MPATAPRACTSDPWRDRPRPAAADPPGRRIPRPARSDRSPGAPRRGGRRASSIASRRTWPLQPTHGFGVSPAANEAMNGSTTPARNSSRRSIVKCASPIECASERACATAEAEQQLRSASFSRSAHSSSVTATASPSRAHSSAATALSTPPLIATSVRPSSVPPGRSGGDRRARSRTAAPRAPASASAATSAACSLPGLRPPSSAAICAAPIRAASSTGAPRTSVTAALPAAVAAPQPWASKPASVTRSCSTVSDRVTWSQHAPPSTVAVSARRLGAWRCPCGEVR